MTTKEHTMYGTLDHLGDGRWQLRFTRTLLHPPEKVWRAITEPEHLEHWFPTTIEGERSAGARLRFLFPGGQAPPIEGEMLAYELTLLDTLDERGKAARDGAGWHTCLDGLAAHLRGEADARRAMDTWKDVHPQYVESFGPEAATIGPPEGFE